MKKLVALIALIIILTVAWLATKKYSVEGVQPITSPSGRFLLERCEQPCQPTVTVLTEPNKGFRADCPMESETQQELLVADRIEWLFEETTLRFGNLSVDLRYDCYEPELLVSPSGQKTMVIEKNCLFGLDELQICRRALTLEKMSKAGDRQLSFACDYPLNQFDWQKVTDEGIGWNSVEDDMEWPLKPDSQFTRASGDATAKLSLQMMCGAEAVIL